MASEFKHRAKEIISEAVIEKRRGPPQIRDMFMRRLALKPLIIVSLLLCASVAFAAYRVYYAPRGRITAPADGSHTPRLIEIEGFTKNIPPEHQYIWITVDIPDLNLCWPKRQIYSANKAFKAKILESGPNHDFTVCLSRISHAPEGIIGKAFKGAAVVVILQTLDNAANDALRERPGGEIFSAFI